MTRNLAITTLLSVALVAVTTPIAINRHLRWTYEQTLAHWRSKVTPPDRVFIGDSLVAGGGDFGHFGTINLAVSGASSAQAVGLLPMAEAYNPRHIVVMAGYNDIFLGYDDPATVAANWDRLLADKRVAVVLLPHSRFPAFNAKIDRYNGLIAALAKRAGRAAIQIPGLTDATGLRVPEMETSDHVHFTPSAYAKWQAALDSALG